MNAEKISCVICKGSSQCLKCENKQLKNQLEELSQELLKFYTTDTLNKLYLSSYQMSGVKQLFQISEKPMVFEYKHYICQSYFLTLTFDPARFGLAPYPEQRIDYILYHMYKCCKYVFIKGLYGCFEHHKNGIVHSHMIIITEEKEQVYKYLHKQFTDNPHNKIAVHIDKAKHPQAKQYIEKESIYYFKYEGGMTRASPDAPSQGGTPLPVGGECPKGDSRSSESLGKGTPYTTLSLNDKKIIEKYLKKNI